MSTNTSQALPPTEALLTRADLLAKHPTLLTPNRLKWALRNRKHNGLEKSGAIIESPLGVLLIHQYKFLEWVCGKRGLRRSRKVPAP